MTETARKGTPQHPETGEVVRVPLVDLARAVVTAVAPEQVAYFELVTDAWDAGVQPGSGAVRWTGGSVGSGVDPTVLSDLVYPLVTGTVAQVLGAAGFAGLRRRRWWRRPRKQVRTAVVEVPVARIEQLRQACIAHGTTLGLSTAEATMLADALYGFLRGEGDR